MQYALANQHDRKYNALSVLAPTTLRGGNCASIAWRHYPLQRSVSRGMAAVTALLLLVHFGVLLIEIGVRVQDVTIGEQLASPSMTAQLQASTAIRTQTIPHR